MSNCIVFYEIVVELEQQLPFQNMSTLVVLTIILASVSSAPSQSTNKAMKSSVSKVGIINPVVFLMYTVIKASVVVSLV